MKRRTDLDFAKGIGIILMVLGHSFSAGNGDEAKVWFYSFHMPLFFIVSGILAKMKAEQHSLSEVAKSKAKTLMIPYFLWCGLIAVYLSVMGRKPFAYFLDLLKSIVAFQGLSALWFLPCLFLAQMLFYGLRKAYDCHSIFGWTMAIIVSVLGFCAPAGNEGWEVIFRACTGTSFVWLGWGFSKLYSTKCHTLGGYCALCAAHILMARLNGQVSVLDRAYGNALLFYVNALLGTWLVVQLYHGLMSLHLHRWTKTISWFGKNSLVLVCTSFFVIEIIRILDYKVFGSRLPRFGNAEGIILCMIVMGIEAAVIMISNRYFWFAFGRQKPNRLI